MSSVKEFILPDLGEGLTESELVSWHVAVGDKVDLNQVVAEVETAKAIVQLPSPFAGVVAKLYEEAGATVQVGAPLMSFEVRGRGGAARAQPGAGRLRSRPSKASGRPTRRARGGHAAAAAAPAEPSVSEPVAEPVEAPAPAEPRGRRGAVRRAPALHPAGAQAGARPRRGPHRGHRNRG